MGKDRLGWRLRSGYRESFVFGSRDCDLPVLNYVFDCKQGSVAGLAGGGGVCVCVDPPRGLKEPETCKPLNAGWVAARLGGVERRG